LLRLEQNRSHTVIDRYSLKKITGPLPREPPSPGLREPLVDGSDDHRFLIADPSRLNHCAGITLHGLLTWSLRRSFAFCFGSAITLKPQIAMTSQYRSKVLSTLLVNKRGTCRGYYCSSGSTDWILRTVQVSTANLVRVDVCFHPLSRWSLSMHLSWIS
jgi:hypothetical protein